MRKIVGVVGLVLAAGCGSAAPGSRVEIQSPVAAAAQRAYDAIVANAEAAKAQPEEQFVVRDVIRDADGTEHVRFDRTYGGLRVIGGDLVVHGARAGGMMRGISNALSQKIAVDVKPSLGQTDALSLADREFEGVRSGDSTLDLVVYARNGRTVLAYEAVLEGFKDDQTPTELHVIVDARTGETLDKWDGIETAASAGTGNGYFVGNVLLTTNSISGGYELRDPSRGGQYTTDMKNKQQGSGVIFTDLDNAWGDGTLANRQTVGVDAQFGTAMTWDYYQNVHGRNGIANDGRGAFNRVHYGRRYNNAFWSDSCFCMTYGDGDGTTFNPFDSIDVAGHEMSHGVTSRTANLTYSGESGGLNEATSDIFGTSVEFYANNANDVPDYLIGEELYKAGGGRALRYMYRPSKDGRSADCWSSTVGSLDVHYSSGVANHFFYLLSEGSGVSQYTDATGATTCNGGSITGIGRAAAEQIWYRALTVYMTSNTNYAGARTATLNAARDLFGSTGAEYAAVAATWSAVGVN